MTSCRARPEQPTKTTKLRQDPRIEPKLEDMLADPMVELIMRRDGICRADVERVINQTRIRLMTAKIHADVAAA